MTTAAVTMPAPLVKPFRHPLRWFRNEIQTRATQVLFVHIGVLIVVGLYYLLFEVNPTMNTWWHHAVSNSDMRHSIRDVGEGVLGGYLAKAIVWNHYKKSNRKAGRVFRNLQRLHLPPRITALLAAAISGAAAFAVGYYLLRALHTHAHASSSGYVGKVYLSDWNKKVLGLFAAFASTKPLRIIFDDLQLWFAQRKVLLGKKVRFYHVPQFRARHNDVLAQGISVSDSAKHGGLQTYVTLLLSLVGVGLAGLGYYVLNYIA